MENDLRAIILCCRRDGRRAAVDAFGREAPPAHVAWEFLEHLYEAEILPRPAGLPSTMPPTFLAAYDAHRYVLLATNAHQDE